MTLSKEAWDFKIKLLSRFLDLDGQSLWPVQFDTEESQPESFEDHQYNRAVDDCWRGMDWDDNG